MTSIKYQSICIHSWLELNEHKRKSPEIYISHMCVCCYSYSFIYRTRKEHETKIVIFHCLEIQFQTQFRRLLSSGELQCVQSVRTFFCCCFGLFFSRFVRMRLLLCVYLYRITWSTWRCTHFVHNVCARAHWKVVGSFRKGTLIVTNGHL